jgi:sugar phosphate isomerase/epimerase
LTQITMLNNMAAADFVASLDIQQSWGITVLDLKSDIFGKSLIELTLEEAERAARSIADRGMSVYCFSTELFQREHELGAAFFQSEYMDKLEHLLALARIMKPKVIRLLAARTAKRSEVASSVAYIVKEHAWLIDMYREAIDRISAAGFEVTIENECNGCIFAAPEEIMDFFAVLDRADHVYFTYDVQNLWQMGTFPTMEVYRKLAPLIGFYHVKGGQIGEEGDSLVWKSGLEDASWPVAELTRQVIADGNSPVICINPSHGKEKPGYRYEDMYKRDLDYLNAIIRGHMAGVIDVME